MYKLIRRIKSKIRRVLFLLWHDKQTMPSTKWIILTTAGLIGTLWGFPLDNVMSSGVMHPEIKRLIRIQGTKILSGIGLSLLFGLLWMRNRKYNSDKLTEEELDNYLHYMNETKD